MSLQYLQARQVSAGGSVDHARRSVIGAAITGWSYLENFVCISFNVQKQNMLQHFLSYSSAECTGHA